MRAAAFLFALVLLPTALAATFDDSADDAALCREPAGRIRSFSVSSAAGSLVLELEPVSVDADARCAGIALPGRTGPSEVYRDLIVGTADHSVEFALWDRIFDGVRSGVCVGVSVTDGASFDAWSECAAGPEPLPVLHAEIPLSGTAPGQFGPVAWDVTGAALVANAFARAEGGVVAGGEDEAGPLHVTV